MLDVAEAKEVAGAPVKERRWAEQVEECVEERLRKGEIGPTTAGHARLDLLRFPIACRRAGIAAPPFSANMVEAEHIWAYRRSPIWTLTTKRPYLAHLHAMLRHHGSPLADQAELWTLPRGRATRRRWITREQLAALYDVSSGRGRVHVVLQGFNGLREIELHRLRWRDVNLADGAAGTIALLGKGRNGGKPRTIPLAPTTRAVLISWSSGSELVYPVCHSVAYGELAGLGRQAGIPFPVAGHVLRRSWGRIAYRAGVPLVDIQHIYGHESLEQTAYYIGVDEDAMAAGLSRFDAFVGAERPEQGA